MKLTDVLTKRLVFSNLRAQNKYAVIEELCQALAYEKRELSFHSLIEVLLERERLGSTGIGNGIAIPHGKLPNLHNLILSFGRSQTGINFDSFDGKPVYLFFLIITPETSIGIHLKTLAYITRLLKSDAIRYELMQAKDAEEIFWLIQQVQDENF